MAAGRVTQGNRRPDGTPVHELEPGNYAFPTMGSLDILRLCNPDGAAGHVTGDRWLITVEDDETVTVTPSIFWNAQEVPPGWHGFLERGIWREV